jgi:hypothetical protein
MARLSSETCGEMAFDALSEHIGGLNRKMWCHHAGLKPSQLTRGIDWLRDLFDDRLPFVRVRRGGEEIYLLALDDRDVREYMERRLRSQITRAKRDYNEIHGFAKEHPTRENIWQEEMARRRVHDLTGAYEAMFGEAA